MGALYEVVHRGTKRRAALKLMRPELVHSAELRSRFELETRVTASIESDHIVEVYDAGTDAATGAPYLVMELLRGRDLSSELIARGPMAIEEVAEHVRQTSRGLDKAHDASIVHRDIKPENLFLARRDDGSPCVKILDFGVAKLVADSRTAKTTRALGTALYMAPEQIRGDAMIGPLADIYALGHVAFTLLVGRPYFHEEEASEQGYYGLRMAIVSGAKEAPSKRAERRLITLPEGFDRWFFRATAADPLDRYDGARELADELDLVAAAHVRERHLETQAPTVRNPSRGGAP